jgi:hypothetical protein
MRFPKVFILEWLRYQTVISLETEVGITSQRNKKQKWTPGHTEGRVRCLGGVKMKQPLSTGHTCRETHYNAKISSQNKYVQIR